MTANEGLALDVLASLLAYMNTSLHSTQGEKIRSKRDSLVIGRNVTLRLSVPEYRIASGMAGGRTYGEESTL